VDRPLLFSGFELNAPSLPPDAQVLRPHNPLPALPDFKAAVARSLRHPLDGPPLSGMLKGASRIAVVVDDFSLPVPTLSRDCRREMLDAVVEVLEEQRVPKESVSVIIATGLSRQFRPSELEDVLGPGLSGFQVRCHDAERIVDVVRLGEEPEAPLELNGAVAGADLVIYLNVVSTPLHAGLYGLVSGTVPYRTARLLNAPRLFDEDKSALMPGSAVHRAHEKVAALLLKKTRVFQVSAVLNNELWSNPLQSLLRAGDGLSRPLQMWNSLPPAVRHRAARLLKASYRPVQVVSGSPPAVEPRSLEAYFRQNVVDVDGGPADVLVFGVPDQGPASIHSSQNPVLATHLALGVLANLHTDQPLLREGGVLIFANPLTRDFDARVHGPHAEFYEKILRDERNPASLQERFEPTFATRADQVQAYQQRYAFHGAHPFLSWYACAPARRRAGRIIAAHGDPRVCARLGFMPAADIEEALAKARDFLGSASPRTVVMELPPAFWARLR